MRLQGKSALITGGGTGLGRAIALQLAKEGVNLAINYSRSGEDAEKTAADARRFGVKAIALKADISVPEEAENLVVKTAETLCGLDLLINNAGITKAVPLKDLDDLDSLNEDDFLRIFKTNSLSIFFTSRAASRIMKKQGSGHIINTVSSAGLRPPVASSIAYAVSKAAGVHFTKCLALALAPEINVNAVAPGMLLTRWWAGENEEAIAKMQKGTALGKAVDVEECASMYLALARNDSMTGQIISVDAGFVI